MASCGGIRLHLGFFFLPLLFFLEDGFLLLSDDGLHAQRETPSIAVRLHLHLQFMHRAILKRTSLTGHHMERRSIPCKFFFFFIYCFANRWSDCRRAGGIFCYGVGSAIVLCRAGDWRRRMIE